MTVGIEKAGDPNRVLCSANIGQVYEAFLCAMKDYTLDSRGDVGAWYIVLHCIHFHYLCTLYPFSLSMYIVSIFTIYVHCIHFHYLCTLYSFSLSMYIVFIFTIYVHCIHREHLKASMCVCVCVICCKERQVK